MLFRSFVQHILSKYTHTHIPVLTMYTRVPQSTLYSDVDRAFRGKAGHSQRIVYTFSNTSLQSYMYIGPFKAQKPD